MSDKEFEPLGPSLLVHVEFQKGQSAEDLEELYRLCESAGGDVVDAIVCKREAPDPRFFIGSGKVQEVKDALLAHDASCVIFNSPLTPAQERNLEKELNVKVMDRIALILLIFAIRARTYEGKLQVELARLKYAQARLVRGWTHLERQKGGFGLRGGPGETQIELDRRALRTRIAALNEDLEIVAKRRDQNRAQRAKNAIPVISFVGYTNAGKSTLFNRLTNSDVYAADQLFATLDPTLRNITLPIIGKAVFADTVGFIRHLPHDLVAAFRATLEESAKADLQLHIVDASDPRLEDNIKAVDEVLAQIKADKVPRLLVYNKSDLVEGSRAIVVRDESQKIVRVNVSAKTGMGLDELLSSISELLSSNLCAFTANIRPKDAKVRAFLYELKAIEKEEYLDDGSILLTVKAKACDLKRIDKKTNGALSLCVTGDIPWKQGKSEDLDFNFDFDDIESYER